ncbi:AAA family ATPase [Thiohalorhabdus sp.]|uniref:AAA family ATPase n=1 Tax=Thiohalorhabdus sp. TaxID=3094134 RepID=UPI002FC2931B
MRIARLDLAAFGAFLDRSLELPAGPGVIVGPNEAGKTTLFTAVTTLLYGFRPANERDFPYVPRAGGRRAELTAAVALDEGTAATATRRLLSSPVGEWQTGDSKDDLGNHPLPAAAHVERDLYNAVYALTLEDMAALEGDAFVEVEQRLLGELGNPWQRPARTGADELDAEAKGLWRPDRKGKPRHAELKKTLKEQREQLREAQQRQEALREQEAERARLAERLAELAERRAELRDRIRRSEQVGTLRADLARLDRLAEAIGDIEAVRRLGDDPGRDWRELTEQGEALAKQAPELAEEVGRQRDRRGRVSEADRRLVADDEAAGIRAAAAKAEEAAAARERAAAAEDRARAELRERADTVLADDWDDGYGPILEALAPAELRDRAAAAEVAREAERDAERRLESLTPPADWPTFSGIYLVLPLAVGLALAAVSAFWWQPLWPLSVLALLVAAGTGVYNLYVGHLAVRDRRRYETRRTPLEQELAEARSHREAARSAVAELLDGLPLPEGALAAPGADVAGRIEALRSAWQRYRDARGEREEQARGARDRAAAVRSVLARHAMEAGEDLAGAAEALEQRLQAARNRVREAEEAADELERLTQRCRDLTERLGDLAARRGDLAGRIRTAVPGELSWAEQLERADRAAANLHQWQADWRSLRERYPELSDPRAAVAEAGDDLLEGAALDRAKEELEALDNESEDLGNKQGRLDEALEQGRGVQDVGLIQGRIEETEAAMAAAERAHDRLRMAECLIREADRRFREAHQPDVLRRASGYLDRVTGGRYSQLDLDEDVLRVRDHAATLREVSDNSAQLSRGTRDQVFLALRLAVADHLDAGHERLPLLLDEVFVNWDPARQEAGVAGLRDMAGDRQVLLFTCHPEIGQRMARLLGTDAIDLAAPAD